jgi:hypothetical protein
MAGKFERWLTASLTQRLKTNERGGLDHGPQCEISMPELDVPFNKHGLDCTHKKRLQIVVKYGKDGIDVVQTVFKFVLRR